MTAGNSKKSSPRTYRIGLESGVRGDHGAAGITRRFPQPDLEGASPKSELCTNGAYSGGAQSISQFSTGYPKGFPQVLKVERCGYY
jgi:hypothetical protein